MRVKSRLILGVAVLALGLGGPVAPQVFAPEQAQAQGPMLPDVADLVEKLLPAVVEISVQSKNPDAPQGAGPLDSSPFKNFFDEFLKRKQQGQNPPDGKDNNGKDAQKDPKNNEAPTPAPDENNLVNSMGSGFIIDPKGIIVTNNHVIADAVNIQVHLQDGTLLKAELVGHDPKTDIAVIRVKPDKDLPAVAFGDSDKARIGQWVVAIGNPFGLGGSVSLGIVSARNRDINAGPYDDYLQTDAAINKGNSGGPLFDLEGHVLGVNTAIFSPSGGSVGIGFSVPANEAKSVADQLVKFGETRRGWLGVKLQALTPDVAEGLGMQKPHGALVADVTADGPSEKAGLKAGDVIVSFDGKAIDDSRALRRIVAETEVGRDIAVTVLRDGKEQAIKVTLGRLEEGEKLMAQQDAQKKPAAGATSQALGMTLSTITDDLRGKFKIGDKVTGVIVTDVAKDSAAAAKGIAAGDVIEEAGGKPVASPQDVADAADQALKDGKSSLLVLVAHGGNAEDTRFVALKLK
ncbi:MAG: Do family serine endopeptidase [Alphaproteobacteria bacterium]|nr:Do family serine endopeptidase [Alphaproteobacteria bacterium]